MMPVLRMGRALKNHISCRWCFDIYLPFGLLSPVVIFVTFQISKPVAPMSLRENVVCLDPLGTAMPSIGAGLLSTLQSDFGTGQWMVYQVILGEGIGMGFQLPAFLVQTTLLSTYWYLPPHGLDALSFIQLLGDCIFVSIARDIFRNRLLAGNHTTLPMVDPRAVNNVGPTNFQRVYSS